ncbi:MAG: hypothetical protein ABEJ42_00170 [Halobacteriaceae archaeon]
MDLTEAFYAVAAVAWMGLLGGAWIAVDLGHTEPWLSATVAVETKSSIRDADDLRRFAEGTVAVADAFEDSL